MMSLTSNWDGPYSFIPTAGIPWMYESIVAKTAGVYLWTVRKDDEFLVNYVGVGISSMLMRQEQHITLYLHGDYTFYDSKDLSKGKKREVYNAATGYKEFFRQLEYYQAEVRKQLLAMSVVFAPFEGSDASQLIRIESALISALRECDEVTVDFLDNARLSKKLAPHERDLSVKIEGAGSLRGIPEEFNA